jgi:hypothetical protein
MVCLAMRAGVNSLTISFHKTRNADIIRSSVIVMDNSIRKSLHLFHSSQNPVVNEKEITHSVARTDHGLMRDFGYIVFLLGFYCIALQ